MPPLSCPTPAARSRTRPAQPQRAIPTSSTITLPRILCPVGLSRLWGESSRIGSKDPRPELIANTSVLASDMPMALTLWPNRTAPNPHANPVRIAIQTADVGARPIIVQLCGAIAVTIAAGSSRHETTMNRVQTFSQSHLPRNRIGRVKLPFIMPDKIARSAPARSILLIPVSIPLGQ